MGDKITGERRYRHWMALLGELAGLKIAWIGTKREAEAIEHFGTDLRGIPLEMLADVMASSTVIVGPSSGPMHFASLCGLPHVVFSDKRKWNLGGKKGTNWTRYKRYWNPLGTDCTVIDEFDWQPPVSRVMKALEKYL